MVENILLINSDLAKNRGDRAIAEGIMAPIRTHYPDAHITGLSEYPQRDQDWFGIDFLNMNFQSLNPFALIRLCRVARRQDIVLWGGGEILKDYTNKAALWYWVIKMTLISLVNSNLYGVYQGIGPTKSAFSKKLIVFVVNRCKVFIVRDQESADKLIRWGAKTTRLYTASDPAVLPQPDPIDDTLGRHLATDYDIDAAFLDNFICLGPRDWFHYKPGGILPFKYKRNLYALFGKSLSATDPRHARYFEHLSTMISELTTAYHTNVLLVPMHMGEGDTELCELLKSHAADPAAVRILDKDTLSPRQLRSVIARAQAMIGFRLHSNIIGISAGVPSMNIYYVDKGRVFFDQIGQSRFALPIEQTLNDQFVAEFLQLFAELYAERPTIKTSITTATDKLRQSVSRAFTEVFDV